ncbi:hypothetical protein [Pontiella agarivorans]|uniref:Uncharacterized protein n=1 Tax=Pontiella agarivorans TaxID=3038953 RepID=A0ABU5MXY5_9BACT|nr:hypothetical protein [Pontiella agarivorans]MDZ8119078.1 hypothetical protein [Pontiella agarivorans]
MKVRVCKLVLYIGIALSAGYTARVAEDWRAVEEISSKVWKNTDGLQNQLTALHTDLNIHSDNLLPFSEGGRRSFLLCDAGRNQALFYLEGNRFLTLRVSEISVSRYCLKEKTTNDYA